MEHLYEKLTAYSASDAYPFHMPGHKRNGAVTGASLPYELDITEIDGFDDLHHADGILQDAEQEAARVFGAGETRFLINGSTVGILSAVLGCTSPGGRILMARNCHKSVYHAAELGDLHAEYLYPPYDEDTELNMEIRPEDVEAHLAADAARTGGARCRIQAVVITSPTYDGVVSDVGRIAEIVHRYGIPLIVDAAHGAHFGFHPYFPPNANALGADVVIHSVHKTLPSLTQTALLHMNGNLADRGRIDHFLDMLQSSSPSYVLLSSIDECVRVLAKEREPLFAAYVRRLKALREKLGALKNMRLLETESYDPSKVVISVKGLAWRELHTAGAGDECKSADGCDGAKDVRKCEGTSAEENEEKMPRVTGPELYRILREEFHLQLEMAAGSYVVAMTSIADTDEGFDRLSEALTALDARMCPQAAAQTAANCEARNPGMPKDKPGRSKESGGPYGARFAPKEEAGRPEGVRFAPKEEAGRPEGVSFCRKSVPWPEAAGCIALEYAYLYPPGIPLTVPGERISEELTSEIRKYEAAGLEIKGTRQKGRIEVLWDEYFV